MNDLEGDQDVDEDEDEEDEEGSQRDDADDIPARIGTPAGAGVKRGPPSTGGESGVATVGTSYWRWQVDVAGSARKKR